MPPTSTTGGDFCVAITTVAGVKVEAEAPTEQEAIDKLAFKIVGSREPKFVELDLARYAHLLANRHHYTEKDLEKHPLETAKQIAEMHASGLTDEQIAAKLGVSVPYI